MQLLYNRCRVYNTGQVSRWIMDTASVINSSRVHTLNKNAAGKMAIAFVNEKR